MKIFSKGTFEPLALASVSEKRMPNSFSDNLVGFESSCGTRMSLLSVQSFRFHIMTLPDTCPIAKWRPSGERATAEIHPSPTKVATL